MTEEVRENMEWTGWEIEFVMNAIANGDTYDNIAKKIGRNSKSIRKHVILECNRKIKNKEGIKEYYCNEYNLCKEEFSNI